MAPDPGPPCPGGGAHCAPSQKARPRMARPPARLKSPPTSRFGPVAVQYWVMGFTSGGKDGVRCWTPVPSAVHADPVQHATRAAATPPIVVKRPPAKSLGPAPRSATASERTTELGPALPTADQV